MPVAAWDAADSLWQAYFADRSPENRNRLVEHYRPLFARSPARFVRYLSPQFAGEDFAAAADLALLQAVARYDPQGGASFKTYANVCIEDHLRKCLRRLNGCSPVVWRFRGKRRDAAAVLSSSLGRPPTDDELAEYLGFTLDRFAELSRRDKLGTPVLLSVLHPADWHKHGVELPDPQETNNAYTDDTARGSARRILADFLPHVANPRDRDILRRHFTEGLSLADIARSVGLTRERVRQIVTRLLSRMRRRYGEREDLRAVRPPGESASRSRSGTAKSRQWQGGSKKSLLMVGSSSYL